MTHLLRASGLCLLAATLLLLSASTPPNEERPFLRWHDNVDSEQVAIGGYDPVAYHIQGEALPGKPEFAAMHRGVRFHFAKPEHKEFFEAEPEAFLPAYGGWCAFLIANDSAATGFPQARLAPDPTLFKVVDERLLLFARAPGWSGLALWEQGDEEALLARGDEFWAGREALAAKIGEKPAGLHPHAPLETAQFDFLIGEWDSFYELRLGRATEARGNIQGVWKARYGWEGFAIYDDWSQVGGRPGNSGPAIRSFDPRTRKWVMHYIPINQPLSSVWAMEGGFDETGLHAQLSGRDPDGTSFLQRVHFVDIEADSFTWKSDRSYDDGETWILNWGLGKNVRRRSAGDH